MQSIPRFLITYRSRYHQYLYPPFSIRPTIRFQGDPSDRQHSGAGSIFSAHLRREPPLPDETIRRGIPKGTSLGAILVIMGGALVASVDMRQSSMLVTSPPPL